VDKEKKIAEHSQGVLDTHQLGPEGAGLPSIPEPSEWPSSYGIDEAVAIAVVPERALIFWELAGLIECGIPEGACFRLVRIRLIGETPKREEWWPVGPIGRFQDSGLQPGSEYIYVIARFTVDDETPILVTNPIRMPVRAAPGEMRTDLPSSIDLGSWFIKRVSKREGE